jgi:hypothetical protein
MGFANIDRNIALLEQYSGDLNLVVTQLLEETTQKTNSSTAPPAPKRAAPTNLKSSQNVSPNTSQAGGLFSAVKRFLFGDNDDDSEVCNESYFQLALVC